ncbi:unnamed protein product [Dicrocoelium dendriticum]|nr:unnamed protein product [Dicrocoelium dendriticum]
MIICDMDFLKQNYSLLLTISGDACKLWNLDLQELLHTFTCPHSCLSAFSVGPHGDTFLYATKSGKIVMAKLSTTGSNSSELCSLSKYLVEFTERSRVPMLANNTYSANSPVRAHWSNDRKLEPRVSNDVVCQILAMRTNGSKLAIITCARFCVIDFGTRQLDASWNWSDLGLSGWTYILDARMTVDKTAVNFWLKGRDNQVVFIAAPILREDKGMDIGDTVSPRAVAEFSLLAVGDLLPNSVLRKALCHRNSTSSINQPTKSRQSLNRPITFGHPIKSSGYGRQQTPRKMFEPHINPEKHTRISSRHSTYGTSNQILKTYTGSETAPSTVKYYGSVDSCVTPVYHLTYSPSGTRLAAALGSGVCLLLCSTVNPTFKQPTDDSGLGLLYGNALCGHSGPVLCAAWSSDGQLLLTSSSDRTARLWRLIPPSTPQKARKSVPLLRTALIMDSPRGGLTSVYKKQSGQQTNIVNRTAMRDAAFTDCIQFANFHFLDAFVYLVCQNVLRLYSYELADVTNKLDKGRCTSVYKLVGDFLLNSCNRITAVASANIFYSYIMLCAGSDRSLSVVDLNTNQIHRKVESAHCRNITAIALNQGSLYCSPNGGDPDPLSTNNSGYSTFATVAPKDCVRMWDLRDTTRPVVQFLSPSSSISSAVSGASMDPLIPPVNATFSPCGRHLVVGGRINPDQMCPVIYDIRKPCSHPLTILRPATDKVVSAPATVVAWHPLRAEVATGSHDGKLGAYVP